MQASELTVNFLIEFFLTYIMALDRFYVCVGKFRVFLCIICTLRFLLYHFINVITTENHKPTSIIVFSINFMRSHILIRCGFTSITWILIKQHFTVIACRTQLARLPTVDNVSKSFSYRRESCIQYSLTFLKFSFRTSVLITSV